MESKVSGHWTDDQLIALLYELEHENDHLRGCAICQARLSDMRLRRQSIEVAASEDDSVGFEFLAAQRRGIYAKITTQPRWWSKLELRAWGSAAAMMLVLGGGLVIYEENHRRQVRDNVVSDVQLAQDVSTITQDSEAEPTGPLHELFEE